MFELSIETNAGSYMHGFHLGTETAIARSFAEEIHAKRIPKIGDYIVTVALMKDGKIFDVFYGNEWDSEMVFDWED